MRILLFTLEYPPFFGGVSNFYFNIERHWPKDTESEICILHNNENNLVNPRIRFLPWLPSVFELFKAVRKNRIEHILVGHILPLGLPAMLVSRPTGKKYSVIMHGMDFAYACRVPRKKKLALKILANAHSIIVANSHLAALVLEQLPGCDKKLFTVNPGVDTPPRVDPQLVNDLRKKYSLFGKTVLFSVSRLVKRKGMDKTIESMPRIAETIPNAVYIVSGTGPDESYLKELAEKRSELKNKIIFTGKISNEEKWALLEICDIFIMPSREIDGDFEGFGIVYIEAAVSSRAVIAGKSGGTSDAVKEGISGLLVEPHNTDQITDAVIKLANDNDLRVKMGNMGRIIALRDFRWDDKVKTIESILSK